MHGLSLKGQESYTKSISTAKKSGPQSVSSYFSEKIDPKPKNCAVELDCFKLPPPFKSKEKGQF